MKYLYKIKLYLDSHELIDIFNYGMFLISISCFVFVNEGNR